MKILRALVRGKNANYEISRILHIEVL